MKVLFFVGFLFFFAIAERPTPFKAVVSHLQEFASATGGFTLNKSELPSLEATYFALGLSTIYGTRQQLLKQVDVTPFIETLQNADFGYGRRPGVASDLSSLRQAVFSYKMMGYAVPDEDKAVSYVKSLLNQNTGLFSIRAGEEDSLMATAFALQILDVLGQLKSSPVASKFDAIRAHLKKVDAGTRFDTDSDETAELLDNYIGLIIASFSGYKIADPSKWASYIISQQKADGGFGSFTETLYAVASLKVLTQLANDNTLDDKLNLDALVKYANTAPNDLGDLARAHYAVALTDRFEKNFDISVSYLAAGVPVKGAIVQGTQFKPVLSVKNHNGVPHAGLDPEVSVALGGSTLLDSELHYIEQDKHYVSDQHVETTGKFGVLAVKYTATVHLPGFGDLTLKHTDNRRVGYGIVVDAHAVSDVGKEIPEGDAISVGTNLKFTVKLHNQTVHDLVSGDFVVTFKFLDSSDVVVHSAKKDGKNNRDAITFEYTLKSSSIPAGVLSFSFEVSNQAGVHTQRIVKYLFNIPMIASQISFDRSSAQYKIGDKVRVTALPANYPDLRSVSNLDSKDASGNDASESRAFFLDIHSHQGLLLKSVRGVAAKAAPVKYSFEFDAENSLDFIGNNVATFRYQPVEGPSVHLSNFDSSLNELFQDSHVLNFTVAAELHVANLQANIKTELFYGNEVEFKFNVRDALTKKLVKAGQNEKANVYLLLQHKDEDRAHLFTSSHHAATQAGEGFTLSYVIDPNAIQGPGVLTLVAQGPDGASIPLYKDASSKQEIKYDVTVGGKIDFQSKTYTQSSYSTKVATLFHETSFVVEFSLSCEGKILKDAILQCRVATSGAEPFSVPVATNNQGVFSTSWILPHEQPSTDYNVQCFREIDRIRALESKEFKEKKKRREREAKGEDASNIEPEPLVLAPFFEIPVHHRSQESLKLPIRTEVLVTSLLVAAFAAVYYKMSVYTASK